jgi:glycosyltransferase involved in cell wall biosynthesis
VRILTFSTLFPNASAPNHGVFVENRLRHLLNSGGVTAEVIAPVPVFPGRYAGHRAVPLVETRFGVPIHHPRFLAVPKLGLYVTPALLYRSARAVLRQLLAEGARFDLIDAHYFYPDGVAAVLLAREFGLPLTITARGSDITEFPDFPVARLRILAAAKAASHVMTVSAGLKHALVSLGAEADKMTVLRNGVDLAAFAPGDREAARDFYRLHGFTILSVGALIDRKGHDRTIEAVSRIPDAQLLIAGDGPLRAQLMAQAASLGARVRLLGALPHQELCRLYNAADISVLASSREGWANVLLESLACGTPVVASPIAGNDEVIADAAAGLIAAENTGAAIAEAILRLRSALPPRDAVRAYAENFSWDAVSEGQKNIFTECIRRTE